MPKQILVILCILLCAICIAPTRGHKATEERLHNVEQAWQNMQSMVTMEVTRLSTENSKLKQQVNRMGSEILKLQETDSELKTSLRKMQGKTTPEAKYQNTAFGCTADTISLSCPDSRTIFVTSAEYGKYGLVCDGGCCAPHPDPDIDCVESAEENSPQDWLALKIACDNQTSCSFQYTGAVIDACSSGYMADYMQIYFNCLPERETSVIGFTACAGESRYYDENQVVIFDAIVSNFGGHYNPSTSIFICPYHGIYWFDVSFKSANGSRMRVTLILESTRKIDGHAELGDAHLEGHAAALLECNAGQKVWVRAYYDNSRMLGMSRTSTFSGFLLQQFN